jgi:hypothetical protein
VIAFYDRDGRPIAEHVWRELLAEEDADLYRRVALDFVVVDGEPVEVSTVWLGLDHSFGRAGGPLIFETMTFRHGDADPTVYRYATEAGALAGHAALVAELARVDP